MILQALWFLKSSPNLQWDIVAGFEVDLLANPDLGAMGAQVKATDAGVEYIVRQTTAQHQQIVKRMEWNTPPRVLTVDIQPNVP